VPVFGSSAIAPGGEVSYGDTMTAGDDTARPYDLATIRAELHTDGITALRGAFSREWVTAMREDIEKAFARHDP